ncbi:HNH endonuclease [Promicromonospora sp. NPDC050880]|uniref:HNH endonuclease n=1 Tax=Promicromonospora sp. NPDC050880 TaxID=3364406 RepID=UPI00378ADEDA
MSSARPTIPASVKRQVRVEAGHRCAIPTCRQTSGLEFHHIKAWANGGQDTFDNLILLCAVCHNRVTAGEIDKLAVQAYKANLGLIAGRYGDLERRVLERFARDSKLTEVVIDRSHEVLLDYLLEDGIIEDRGPADDAFTFTTPPDGQDLSTWEPERSFGPVRWGLTETGKTLVKQYRTAQRIS